MQQRQQRRGGRPHKGDRHLFQLALLPAPQTDEVLRCADDRGLSMGDYLAVVVARAHGFDTPWPARTGRLVGQARTHRDHRRLSSRVPRAAADAAMQEAQARGLPNAQYLAVVVARAHGFDAELPDRLPATRPEEALISA